MTVKAGQPALTCRACGYSGKMTPFGRQPKQFLFRACLWLLVLLPGYLYDFAIKDRYVCKKCKAEVFAR